MSISLLSQIFICCQTHLSLHTLFPSGISATSHCKLFVNYLDTIYFRIFPIFRCIWILRTIEFCQLEYCHRALVFSSAVPLPTSVITMTLLRVFWTKGKFWFQVLIVVINDVGGWVFSWAANPILYLFWIKDSSLWI